ncbi:uncharacterized protein BDZ83DRAFT_605106 [Colletotrichum acutatum]|uniref:Uncharacterized protein n=1 Tax=Glomerella acutata TaxID=27357 RepID=A0AAD9D0P3_GLOAC|nr:uncharacterized protein BDZ83DRAFT_605106 [Colletotrichum acutatum]KAK1729445.1 hypothetical protein BDZ83DRAFT_605106 [Colletotrichum acutatum]
MDHDTSYLPLLWVSIGSMESGRWTVWKIIDRMKSRNAKLMLRSPAVEPRTYLRFSSSLWSWDNLIVHARKRGGGLPTYLKVGKVGRRD